VIRRILFPTTISAALFLILIGLLIGIAMIVSFKIAFGLALLVLVILLSTRNPFLLIWFMFFGSILCTYYEFYFKSRLPFGIVFIFMFIAFYVRALLKSQSKHQLPLRISSVDMINMTIIAFGLLLFVLSEDKTFGFIGLKDNFKMCFLFLFVRAIKPTEQELHRLFRVFLVIAVIVSLYGIYQYFLDYYSLINKFGGIPELSEGYFGTSSSPIAHVEAKRAYSLFLNSFTLAYYLMIALIIVSVKIGGQSIGKMDRLFFVSLPILLFCLVLTFTRAAWMGCLVGFLFVLLIDKRLVFFKRLAAILLAIAVFGGFIITVIPHNLQASISERFTSIFSTDAGQTSGHYESLANDLALLMKYPLGIGLGKATLQGGVVWNESSLFKVSTEMGVIPGFLYVLVYLLTVTKGLRLYRKVSKTKREIILITLGLTMAYFVSGIVFPVWTEWFPTMMVWILMAVVFNYGEECKIRFTGANRYADRVVNSSEREQLTTNLGKFVGKPLPE
jgi:hypothetical protein